MGDFGGTYGGTTSGDFSQLSILGSYIALGTPTLSGDIWSWTTSAAGPQSWTFNEDTGMLSAVPEPGSLSLLGLGLAGLLYRSRRRSHRLA